MPKSRNCTSPNGYQAFLQCHAVFLKSMRMRCTSNAPCFLEIYYPFWMLRQDLIRHQFVRHFTRYEARKPHKILVPAFLRKRLRSYKFYWARLVWLHDASTVQQTVVCMKKHQFFANHFFTMIQGALLIWEVMSLDAKDFTQAFESHRKVLCPFQTGSHHH
jgi:hypothetical protein